MDARYPPRFFLLTVLPLVISLSGCLPGQGTVKVSSLKLTGVHAVKASQLKSVLATVPSSRLPWGETRYFSREQFEADLKRVVAFYKDRGYPDAKVASFDVKMNDTQDAVDITLDIDEGQPITVDRITFDGFDVLPAAHLTALEARLPLKTGAPLDRALAQASRETALDELKDHGYPYASVRLTERETGEHSRALTLSATPGTLAHYGEIDVVGNTSVSDKVIRRQLLFRPGRVFRLSQLQESQRRLYGLETFQFANVEPEIPEGQQPAIVPIKAVVTEGDKRKVNFGVGYGTEEKARVSIDWRHVNFFGGARTMELEGKYSALSKGGRADFRQPYFFGPRNNLLLTGQSWHRNEPAYTLNTNGARVVVEHRLARGGPLSQRSANTAVSLTYTGEFQSYGVTQEALNTPSFLKTLIQLGLDPLTGRGRGLLSSLAFDVHRSTADSTVNARHGYLLDGHVEQSGKVFGGDYEFTETAIEGRYYATIADRAVVALRLRGASIGSFGESNLKVPFFRRYFLGGATSLRGWGRFEVAPLYSGFPIGGHSMLESSAEFRVPIWGDLSAVAFLDAGNVWNNAWEAHLGDLRYDVGPGLRYMTPIGPVRVDLGYQLNPIPGLLIDGKPQSRRFRFHFSIGQAF